MNKMNLQQLPNTEHSQIHIQEQKQQPIFTTLNNPTLQPPNSNVMPTPTSSWSMESMPWKITKSGHTGDVMEFTAYSPNHALKRSLLHQKRKSEFTAMETLPVKQYISEEKITAHFNGLHISSDFIQGSADNIADSNCDEIPSTSGKCFSNLTYEDYKVTAKELEEKLRNANRISVCEEIKKFNDEQKKVSYLPEALLHRLHKPCTALVLWQPPPVLNILSQKNNYNIKIKKNIDEQHKNETIDDYVLPDVDLLPLQVQNNIDDFIDNNNTCNLDFNNAKSDCMDEDL